MNETENEAPKPLTLEDLTRQVNEVSKWKQRGPLNPLTEPDQLWVIGDFEIRRRKD
jgi:hypothetical protein